MGLKAKFVHAGANIVHVIKSDQNGIESLSLFDFCNFFVVG